MIGIDPAPDQNTNSISLYQARVQGWRLIVNARVLLGLEPAEAQEPQVIVHWAEMETDNHAFLMVDGVEGLHGGYDGEFLPLPRVPPGFHRYFDHLVYDGDGGFFLRLRSNLKPSLDSFRSRRRFCAAFIGAVPPNAIIPN